MKFLHFLFVNRVFSMVIVLILMGVIVPDVFAITAQEVMENALEVYEDIDNYRAVVQTYEADSMQASGSIFESQQPIISFNLFFRNPHDHAVEQIGKSRHGIFRVELLSMLGRLKGVELDLKSRESVLGQNCYMLACSSPAEPDTVIKLWVSQRHWTVQQFALVIKNLTLATTQFKYLPNVKRELRFLPVETRSFFPISKKVLINRVTNYEVNIGLPAEIFERRKNRKRSE